MIFSRYAITLVEGPNKDLLGYLMPSQQEYGTYLFVKDRRKCLRLSKYAAEECLHEIINEPDDNYVFRFSHYQLLLPICNGDFSIEKVPLISLRHKLI